MKRTSRPQRTKDQLYRRLDELCEFAPDTAEPEDLVFWFVQLVRWLRGTASEKKGLRLRYLRNHLEQHPAWRENVGRSLTALVQSWDFAELLAYGGIPRNFHFAGALREWLAFRVLPMACNNRDAVGVLGMAFEAGDDRWLAETDVGALALMLIDFGARPALRSASEAALIDLGYQLVAQAHAPSMRSVSRVERSPFHGLNRAMEEFLAQPVSERNSESLMGRIKQCRIVVDGYREQLIDHGADLNTTFQLDRIAQQLARVALLVTVSCRTEPSRIGAACMAVVKAVTRNTSGRRLIARSSSLVVRNLVDTAASVGRDYLDPRNSGWTAAFAAGAGGGALMALATLFKYEITRWRLPAFYEGIVFSLNYGAMFCAAYLLHFTIATKLPAHTAATLAHTVQEDAGHLTRLRSFLQIWRATVRLQLAGLIGNVLVAAPVAFVLDMLWVRAFDTHVLDAAGAHHALHANSILGPSALYAALTGVFLWLSSLAGAAADNWTRVVQLCERLATNLRVMRSIGPKRARPVARWWVERFGGLTGNMALGFMLGAVPAAFAIMSLPIEIRHVTVSTSSFALAIAAGSRDAAEIWPAAAGVLAIGAVNVSVSFALALQVALAATGRRAHGSARALVTLAISYWLRRKDAPRAERPVPPAAPQTPGPITV